MTKKLLKFSAAVFLLWFGGFIAFQYRINHYQTDESAQTDAIVVLTGGRNRISESAKLLNNGLARRLFISGVEKNSTQKAIERSNGIHFAQGAEVVIGHKATNTIENAIESNEWIRKNAIKSIRLVTSNYHMPRSIVEFECRNPGLKIVAHPVYSDFVKKKWWKKPASFLLIAEEYNKFLYVYIRSLFVRLGRGRQ